MRAKHLRKYLVTGQAMCSLATEEDSASAFRESLVSVRLASSQPGRDLQNQPLVLITTSTSSCKSCQIPADRRDNARFYTTPIGLAV